jgi:hypothetical protein
MAMSKELGKIQRFEIGIGGYDDAMFGLSVTLGGSSGWGVQDFDGTWTMEPGEHHKWDKKDQHKCWADMCQRVVNLMHQAKVKTTAEMVGIPVEVEFENGCLKSWRILEEVL